jgi:hypothetical protein
VTEEKEFKDNLTAGGRRQRRASVHGSMVDTPPPEYRSQVPFSKNFFSSFFCSRQIN